MVSIFSDWMNSIMIRISNKCEYALLALTELAEKYEEGNTCTLEEISLSHRMPQPFLVQIFLELKRAGYISSKRGVNGGYRLRIPPKNIYLGDIIELMEGPLIPLKCQDCTKPKKVCNHAAHCPLESIWNDLRGAISDVISQKTLAELIPCRAPVIHFDPIAAF